MKSFVELDALEIAEKESEVRDIIASEIDRTGGIFRLAPAWVARPGIIVPGRRLKLAEIYMSQELAVNERWLASTTPADNGEYNKLCPKDHGLSYLVIGEKRVLLRRALEVCSEWLMGHGKKAWDVLPKFFDNWGRIPNHLHPCQDHVRKGLIGKPESYHFPLELNVNPNAYPMTAFGVDPSYTDRQLLSYLKNYFRGDNRMTDVSNTVNLIPGTGWFTPACTLHAPGSLVTYELQVASDVTCIPEARVNDLVMPTDLLDRDLPVTVEKDGRDAVCEYILSMLRCPNSGNNDNFRREYFRPPVVVREEKQGRQSFVIYKTGRASSAAAPDLYSAKHTIVFPHSTWEISEKGPFGAIVLGGHGTIEVPGKEPVILEAVALFRTREQIGGDEIFVSAQTAGNLRVNCHSLECLSFYQHFASNTNPEATTLPVPEYVTFD